MLTKTLSQLRLKEVLVYDCDTGTFTWAVKMKGRASAIGEIAGSKHNAGYWRISIDGVRHLAHRLAWLYVHGDVLGHLDIDHVNGFRSDNRLSNLRLATRSENKRNVGVRSDSSSGITGVTLHKKTNRWVARASINGKQIYLGDFSNVNEAIKKRDEFVNKNYGEFKYKNQQNKEVMSYEFGNPDLAEADASESLA